jgi:hypothetical protein
MFKLAHHQKIATILRSLNGPYFDSIGAYFGGGTQLALQYDEYRWSKDIDFICPIGEGYKTLRSDISSTGYDALFSKREGLNFPREIRTDQYGVRFLVVIDDTPIKFEIVAEGRIQLGKPKHLSWCGIPSLNFDDACAEKLLANADRWNDSAIEARDLIDLSVLRLQNGISPEAWYKANNAYDVETPLGKALKNFQADANFRLKCFTALNVKSPSCIIDGIDLLAKDHALSPTIRRVSEEP